MSGWVVPTINFLLSTDGGARGVDAPVAAHYGDPFGEQRRVLDGSGAVDRSHRGVVRVTGPDRLSWLHSLTSQHLGDDGESTLIHVEPETAPALAGYLDGTQDELPPPHTPVELDGRPVGFLGTAVQHAERGPIALAVIKRNTDDAAHLTVAGMAMKAERVVDV